MILSSRHRWCCEQKDLEPAGEVGGATGSKHLTVDDKAHVFVWPYTIEQFSGFDWFVPSHKFHVPGHCRGGQRNLRVF